jgi:hypothetical protein
MYALTEFVKLEMRAGIWAGMWAWRLAIAPFLLLWSFVKALQRTIVATPGALWRLPVRGYRRIVVFRNWLLAKVEYLQAESAKWKAAFTMAKLPYLALTKAGVSPNMAVSLLIGATAVGGGVVVNTTLLSERSFASGDPGQYSAEAPTLDTPVHWEEGQNTLRIDLTGTSVREVTIENVSVGTVYTGSALPSGEQNVVQISGNTISGGTNTRLEVGHLIFEKSRCKKLELSDIQTHTLIVRGNASDGQSLAPSAGTSRMLAIGGGNSQAESLVTSGGTYDRIWIQAPTSGVNGRVGTLRLTNLYTKGGICHLSKITAGTVEILLNEVGEGNGFSTKEFTIATTVTAAVMVIEDNVEVSISEPATQ